MDGWLDQASFEVFRAAHKPDPEGTINLDFVQVTHRDVRATDGVIAAIVRHRKPPENQRPPAILGPHLITRNAAQDLARDAKRCEAVQIEQVDDQWLRFTALERIEKDGLPMFAASEMRIVPDNIPAKPFPDIDAVPRPSGPPAVRVRLRADRLTQIAAIAKAVSSEDASVCLEFEIHGPDQMVVIRASGDKQERMLALMMPVTDETVQKEPAPSTGEDRKGPFERLGAESVTISVPGEEPVTVTGKQFDRAVDGIVKGKRGKRGE